MKKQNNIIRFSVIVSIILILNVRSGNIETKIYNLDSQLKDLVWCGQLRDTVLVLTENNSLYKSEDKGFNWRILNGILRQTGINELEENENEIGKVSKILQSPVDKSLLIFLGTHGINWIGEECGRKIKALNHGRKIKEFIFHPTERNWGLATAFTLCEDFIDEPCKIYKELYVTKDLGENWEYLANYVVQFGWGIVDQSHINAGIPKERILITYEPKAKGDQKLDGWSYKIDFIYSDDFFKTKRIAANKGNKFLLTKNYIFVAQVVHQETQEVMLLSANSAEKLYNFQPIETNSKLFKEHSYTFLDTSDGSVFLHINHFGEASKYGHIYISDSQGVNFSLSVKYNIRSEDNHCDFEKVNSLEGVYMVNVISKKFMNEAEEEIQEDEINLDLDMSNNESANHNSGNIKKSQNFYKDFIKSLISFNKGGKWNRIKAPEVDSEGSKYDCGEYCYLNLIGVSGEYSEFYSVDSAAGIIIANGNVGRYISTTTEDISTYLSRDGGLNWIEIKKGLHIYEVGDHGGIIVIADDQIPTNEVLYSWDEGLTFETLKISEEKFLIKNIIIEPTSKSQHFVVYGENHKKGDLNGVIIGLDFTGLHEPQCKNPDYPDSSDSDYEKWTPNDGRLGHECLMGHKAIYIRKKREAKCFNGNQFERKIIVENCDCTEDDYECDVGYARNDIGEPCVAIDKKKDDNNNKNNEITKLDIQVYTPPLDCKNFYSISKGYRKISGNTCINGVKYDPIIIPCPNIEIFKSVGLIFLFLLAAIIIIYAIYYIIKSYLPLHKLYNDGVNRNHQNQSERNNKSKTQIDYCNIDADGGDNTLFDDEKGDEFFNTSTRSNILNIHNNKEIEEELDV